MPDPTHQSLARRVAARWVGRVARRPTDESRQLQQDEKARQKHIKAASRAFKLLVKILAPLAQEAKAAFPGRDKLSRQRRGRAFAKAVKTNTDMAEYLDQWVGNETQHPKAYSWRGAVIYQVRDHLIYGKPMRECLEEVAKQTDKGFEAITMAEVQAPVREVVPEDIRAFLPKNIVVEVDSDGSIQHITDRFENEHFTLARKIERMHALVGDYNRIAERVRKDLRSSDEVTKLAALITAIIMETGIRPGKEGNGVLKTVDGEEVKVETFGAITLGPEHVRFVRNNFVELSFLGKKGGHNTAALQDTAIIKVLNDYVERALKQGSKYVFTTRSGTQFTYTDLQRYFRENFDGLSPTDFRKLKATETLLAALRDEQENLYESIRGFAKGKKSDLTARVVQAIVDTFNAAVARAQEALSHDSATTTVQAYLNPEIVFQFLSTGSVGASIEEAILAGSPQLSFDPEVFVQRALAKTASKGFSLQDLLDDIDEERAKAGISG